MRIEHSRDRSGKVVSLSQLKTITTDAVSRSITADARAVHEAKQQRLKQLRLQAARAK